MQLPRNAKLGLAGLGSVSFRQRSLSRFIRATGHMLLHESAILQVFFRYGNGPRLGHHVRNLRLPRQQKMPICRHFEERERRDSNPRPPA